VDRSHIITTATGAVTLAVAAPVLISMVGIISILWPVIPILAVGSMWAAASKPANNNNNDTNNTKDNRA